MCAFKEKEFTLTMVSFLPKSLQDLLCESLMITEGHNATCLLGDLTIKK